MSPEKEEGSETDEKSKGTSEKILHESLPFTSSFFCLVTSLVGIDRNGEREGASLSFLPWRTTKRRVVFSSLKTLQWWISIEGYPHAESGAT